VTSLRSDALSLEASIPEEASIFADWCGRIEICVPSYNRSGIGRNR
jgi:hypothetical protein